LVFFIHTNADIYAWRSILHIGLEADI